MRRQRSLLLLVWLALLAGASGPAWAAAPATEMPPWKEPAWQQAGQDEVRLEFKFAAGDKTSYREWQRCSVSAAGSKAVNAEGISTIVLSVEKVSEEHVADASLSSQTHVFTVDGKDAARLLPTWARFAIAPSGRMDKVLGMLGDRSLPTFPKQPVKLGGEWSAPIEFAVSLGVPDAVARGEATYTLVGLAEVDGHRWAKIVFAAELKLPHRPAALQRQIGVKRDESAPAAPGVAVKEAVPESPAFQAGVRPGDRIVELGAMPVNNWGDLLFAAAAAPAEKKTPLVVVRERQRKELSIVVPAGSQGGISAEGAVKGTLVFDATAGQIIRREFAPFTLRVTSSPPGVAPVAQLTSGNLVTQLVPGLGETKKKPATSP